MQTSHSLTAGFYATDTYQPRWRKKAGQKDHEETLNVSLYYYKPFHPKFDLP